MTTAGSRAAGRLSSTGDVMLLQRPPRDIGFLPGGEPESTPRHPDSLHLSLVLSSSLIPSPRSTPPAPAPPVLLAPRGVDGRTSSVRVGTLRSSLPFRSPASPLDGEIFPPSHLAPPPLAQGRPGAWGAGVYCRVLSCSTDWSPFHPVAPGPCPLLDSSRRPGRRVHCRRALKCPLPCARHVGCSSLCQSARRQS